MAPIEIWKPVPIEPYNLAYEISSLGNARRFGKKKTLVPYINPAGYASFCFRYQGKQTNLRVNRLVALAFLQGGGSKLQVNHKDGNKLNNSIDNLEWCSARENTKHRIEVLGIHFKGENSKCAKLSNKDILKIRELAAEAKLTQREIGKLFNIGQTSVRRIINRLTWDHI